ncbi:CYTH domain-containing protein (plasmid) [Burkholderia vietnamiensis]|nr:CYTH domain-containing protein [Burkholderia vietnamiensis]
MERELKQRLPNNNFDALRNASSLASSENTTGAPQLLTSTYFDTAALALHACLASLRVRAVGDERIQTLKLEGSPQAGLSAGMD